MPPLTISSPEALKAVVRFQEAANAPGALSPKALVLGEVLNTLVTSHPQGQRVQLQIKNATVMADCPFPLQFGDKLTVRVDQLHPALVLRVVGQVEEEALKASEFVKLYRSNPHAFKDVLTGLREVFNGNKPDGPAGPLNPKDLLALANLLGKIIISKAQVGNPQYLKDCVAALGLTLERDLRESLADPTSGTAEKSAKTLKGVLLGLSSDLQGTDPMGLLPSGEFQPRLEGFSRLVDQALKVIESLQIVNVLAQEQDQLFALQIPFQCSDGIRMQELFIETEKDGAGKARQGHYKIVLFIDMDALGEMAVEAGIAEGSLHCTIKCQKPDIADFITDSLPELQGRLSGLGYAAPKVHCTLDGELPAWKQNFLLDHRIFSQSTINVCA
jgi:hypothetical protein